MFVLGENVRKGGIEHHFWQIESSKDNIMIRNRLLYEYEQILLGNMKKFSDVLFPKDLPGECEKNALKVYRFAIETFHNWDFDVAKSKLKRAFVKKMKLDTVNKYISYPIELDATRDYDYVLSLLYPRRYSISSEELTERYYARILEENGRFQKGYFSDGKGREKACVCLRYILNCHPVGTSISSLYMFFSSSRGKANNNLNGGRNYLRQYKLDHVCYDLYKNKLDFLHDALPASQKNDFLYHMYCYKEKKIAVSSELKAEASVVAVETSWVPENRLEPLPILQDIADAMARFS